VLVEYHEEGEFIKPACGWIFTGETLREGRRYRFEICAIMNMKKPIYQCMRVEN